MAPAAQITLFIATCPRKYFQTFQASHIPVFRKMRAGLLAGAKAQRGRAWRIFPYFESRFRPSKRLRRTLLLTLPPTNQS
jgi:hypothetical protein